MAFSFIIGILLPPHFEKNVIMMKEFKKKGRLLWQLQKKC